MTHNPSDIAFLEELISKIRTDPPPVKISDYVEGHRILPQNTPHPGPWRNEVTPYLVEIMDSLAPSSPIKHVAVMKGAQLGLTTGAENVVGFYSDVDPSPIMVMSATDDAIRAWGELRLDPALKSLGITLAPELEGNKKSRKSGDTSSMKIFAGGYIVLASAQAASKMRSFPIRILVRDEVDGAKKELSTGEGNWLAVSQARTNSQEATRKIFDLSTPTTFIDSNIYPQFLLGDQRKYFVPCPHCGEMQVLEMGNSKTVHGLKPYFNDNGMLEYVYYVCLHCEEHIFNHNKTEMLKKGEWRPTAEPKEKGFRSYYISSLYSPIGFLSWEGLYKEYMKGKEDLDKRRSFTNLYMGWPFKELGERPDIKKVIKLIDGSPYRDGQVPDEVVFVTMAADVQTGTKNPRIEVEVCGHGRDFRTASILYKVFEGKVDNPYQGAWKDLKEWFQSGGATCRNKQGVEFWPVHAGIDSGTETATVYQFCASMQNFYPMKGRGMMRSNKNPNVDEFRPGEVKKYTHSKLDGTNQILVSPNTIYYKNHIYNNLKIERPLDPDEELPRGFCNFPLDRADNYFQMLTAEEKDTKGNYNAHGRRNEALDVRVYNLCLADFFLAKWQTRIREDMKEKGATEQEIEKFGFPEVIMMLEVKNNPPIVENLKNL